MTLKNRVRVPRSLNFVIIPVSSLLEELLKNLLLILAFLQSVSLFSQNSLIDSSCYWSYQYDGPPGDIQDYYIEINPGTLLQFDFCTYNVPDQLVIGNLIFDIGQWNLPTSIPPKYRGYCEFWFENNQLQVVKNQSGIIPHDISCNSLNLAEGTMRLYYRIPDDQCDLKFSIRGNRDAKTVYSVCIKILELGHLGIDTLNMIICRPQEHLIWTNNCHNIVIQFIDQSIQTQIKIIQPSCLGKFDGSIEFEKYPEKNLYGIGEGEYEVYIENEYCDSLFIFHLKPKELCEWYIPNVFSPNDDGFNDEFMLFTRIPTNYHLEIFDRWGECIVDENLQSNELGWDGRFNGKDAEIGVYVWEITCIDKHLFGDVTLIR